ncbi:MAG: helix-hairpin-helix domain-containing protein [Gemmatimonadetes bacterium]|nr:helix-hairpin-helix domain-containing protein [Gemmatimonadota bacterium]
MATRDDRRAAVILLVLAAAGLVVRFWQPPGAAPGAVAYRGTGTRPPWDSVEARAARLARPLARGERIDLDRASAEELARLPRIGPALAARIVAYREEHGPFGSLEALDQVPGIGPTLLAAVRPHAAFSAAGLVAADPRGRRPPIEGSPLIVHAADPSAAASPASAAVGGRGRGKVSLNTASEAELIQLPGIGPALARAIVADRVTRGPYRTIEDLKRVRGIGAATLKALEGRILVP